MGILTFFGAFLTIIALAVDPFAQQVLTFPVRSTEAANETASILSVHNYSSGVTEYHNGLSWAYGLSISLPRAILSGVLLSNTSLQPECSTGSCSYPGFVSLGVCGQCKDVTEQTIQDCKGDALEKEGSSWVISNSSINCTYISPSGFNLTLNLNSITAFTEELQNLSFFAVDYWSAISRFGVKTLDIDNPITSFIKISQNESILYTSNNFTAAAPKPSLTECAIYWCEKEYAPSNYSGSATGTPIVQTQQLRSGTDDQLTPLPGAKSLSNESSYYVYWQTSGDLDLLFQSVFTGTSHDVASQSTFTLGFTMNDFLQTSNISEIVDSISTKLTDAMRADGSSQKIRGIAFRDEVFIEVRWPWIILPLCVVLGSVFLLLATTIATREGIFVLWKSSVLSLLMTDLDISPEYNFRSLRNVDEARRVSKRIIVILEEDDGLKLLET
ncbi:hypothetical protein N7540_012081 [Penicillium herquei]|nr:hypothetical protein N7540_012081 [Penicillium herquei]